MVLAEAMAAGVPVVSTTSGAIPEVVGTAATLVAAGDWNGLAVALAGVIGEAGRASPGAEPDRVTRYSDAAAAERLAAAYARVLATP
jgi:glycosyltransferase involved in cell wall biosynthesis